MRFDVTWYHFAAFDTGRDVNAFTRIVALQRRRNAQHPERQDSAAEKQHWPWPLLEAWRLAAVFFRIARAIPDPQRVYADGCEERHDVGK